MMSMFGSIILKKAWTMKTCPKGHETHKSKLGLDGWNYCRECKELYSDQEIQQAKETKKKRRAQGRKLGKMRKGGKNEAHN